MSLILAVGNPDHAIVVADRGLWSTGGIVADGSNDPVLVRTRDARLALTFTGLARTEMLEARTWLLLALHSSMQNGMQLSFERLCQLGDLQWSRLRAADPHFTAVMAGFVTDANGTFPALGIVSNWELPPDMDETKEIDDRFRSVWWRHTALRNFADSFAMPAGQIEAVGEDEIAELKALAVAGAPREEIIALAVGITRAAAERPEAAGTLTGEVTSMVLSADPRVDPQLRLHRGDAVTLLGAPSVVSPDAILDGKVAATGQIGRNSACPCGSGKKYKVCHGR